MSGDSSTNIIGIRCENGITGIEIGKQVTIIPDDVKPIGDADVMDEFDRVLISSLIRMRLFRNGGITCDNVAGPCTCGAWHTRVEWVQKLDEQFQ